MCDEEMSVRSDCMGMVGISPFMKCTSTFHHDAVAAFYKVNSRGPVGLSKWTSIFVIAGLAWLFRMLLLCILAEIKKRELLARLGVSVRYNSGMRRGTSDFGLDVSFDTSASLEYMPGLARASLGKLCARLTGLHEINEAVLVWFGLNSVWFNKKCYLVFRRKNDNSEMSIYGFTTLPTRENAKVVEESHEFAKEGGRFSRDEAEHILRTILISLHILFTFISYQHPYSQVGVGEGVTEVGLEGMGVGLQERPTEPAQLTQTTPSSAFIKENMDVLRTMIKEHDLQPKAKMTPRKLVYEEFIEENSGSSKTKDLSERLSKESSDTAKASLKQNPEERKLGLGEKDPDKERLAWTLRYNKKAKILRNVKVNEGSKDQEDHQGIFSAAAEQEEWPMPVWCRMFCQTLSGVARN
nr:reverse transcriptase domain-containing protein [Tanacetum cinerariifolium]